MEALLLHELRVLKMILVVIAGCMVLQGVTGITAMLTMREMRGSNAEYVRGRTEMSVKAMSWINYSVNERKAKEFYEWLKKN